MIYEGYGEQRTREKTLKKSQNSLMAKVIDPMFYNSILKIPFSVGVLPV